jgi:hypothetical protein
MPPLPQFSLPAVAPAGHFCDLEGVRCYCIDHAERLPPFLINLVSASDLWMFVASNGALSAGRVDANHALFPYQTVDRIYDSAGVVGPVTALAVDAPDGEVWWEPFAPHTSRLHRVTRRLYKSVAGDRLWLEEEHVGLRLTFRYGWSTADSHGFIRRCALLNHGSDPITVRVADGLRNLLPAGIPQRLQNSSSNLADAYKVAELWPDSRLAVFALSTTVVDQPTPIEALRASVVTSGGLPQARVYLEDRAWESLVRGEEPVPAARVRGLRGGYFLVQPVTLAAGGTERWTFVADIGASQAELVARAHRDATTDLDLALADASREATARLNRLVAMADGVQTCGDEVISTHHFANTLFNVLRGGTFLDGYAVPAEDFAAHVGRHNRAALVRHAARLRGLPAMIDRADLVAWAEATGDATLVRLAREYLPLMFSRRHGDPSRPWNRFSIRLQDAAGRRMLAYEGNWRDIFQNWEALALAYPHFLDAMVAKFLSASTADGYNPYRISQAGVDWEVPEPEDPWASIGYWGDHQVVYLLKLLEWSARFSPDALPLALRQVRYAYADVPYRIADYAAMRHNPRATITFDAPKHRDIMARVGQSGADARLIGSPDGTVRLVNLTEKLLVVALVRLTNFIPGGGIWMNTQRPEWNDANNALVGYGVSVVTLAYLRRFLVHFRTVFLPALGAEPVALSEPVAQLARQVRTILDRHGAVLAGESCDPRLCRGLVDALAAAGSSYRERLYAHGLGAAVNLGVDELQALMFMAQEFVDHSLRLNLRPDGLAHAYNLLEFAEHPAGLVVHHLPLMLEGQVAMLSSGLLSPAQAVKLLEALRASALFRPDQNSYLLYPDRDLPEFIARNRIPSTGWASCPLFAAMLAAADDRLVLRDQAGNLRFNADLVSREALEQRLELCAADPVWREQVAAQADQVRAVYETVFMHRAFTGRSGSMFGFEGLGCIYWHMVAKLLLAVQENFFAARQAGAPEASRLAVLYHDVRGGLGFNKTPAEYGAFPTDPYSHTPGHSGAQQPGMTGQVKEEILTRWGELGVTVKGGRISFQPALLRADEFGRRPVRMQVIRPGGRSEELTVPAEALAFTLAGTPVIYRRNGKGARLRIAWADGRADDLPGCRLDEAASAALLARDGTLGQIEVELGPGYRPLP